MNLHRLAPVGAFVLGMAAWGGLAYFDTHREARSEPAPRAAKLDALFGGFPIDRRYGLQGSEEWPADIGESAENPAQEWIVDLKSGEVRSYAVWFEGERLCWSTKAGPRCVEGR
jgi:hypothetical protein